MVGERGEQGREEVGGEGGGGGSEGRKEKGRGRESRARFSLVLLLSQLRSLVRSPLSFYLFRVLGVEQQELRDDRVGDKVVDLRLSGVELEGKDERT